MYTFAIETIRDVTNRAFQSGSNNIIILVFYGKTKQNKETLMGQDGVNENGFICLNRQWDI